MKLQRISIATSVASNDPAPLATEAKAVDHGQWIIDINKSLPAHAVAMQRALSSNKPVNPRIRELPIIREKVEPVIASKAKRWVLGLSVLAGFSVVPLAISALATGPIGGGLAAGMLLLAIALHKIANRMK